MTEQLATPKTLTPNGTSTAAPESTAPAPEDTAPPSAVKKRPMLNQVKCC